MTKDEALKLALEALEPLVRRAAPWGELDWLNGCKAITAIKEALAQPDPYKQGYADAMNWKVQNHLEHLPVAQKLSKWKLVPRDPTDEMLKAMDECSTEGYDERLYAGHAASVYMAAVDAAPTPPQRTWVHATTWRGLTDEEIARVVSLAGFAPDWAEAHIATQIVRVLEAKLKEKNT